MSTFDAGPGDRTDPSFQPHLRPISITSSASDTSSIAPLSSQPLLPQPPQHPTSSPGSNSERKRRASISFFIKKKFSGLDGSTSSGSGSVSGSSTTAQSIGTLRPATSTTVLSTIVAGHKEDYVAVGNDSNKVEGAKRDESGDDGMMTGVDHEFVILGESSGGQGEDDGTYSIGKSTTPTIPPDDLMVNPTSTSTPPAVHDQGAVPNQQQFKILGSKKLGTALTKLQHRATLTPGSSVGAVESSSTSPIGDTFASSPKETGSSSGKGVLSKIGQEKRSTQGRKLVKGFSIQSSFNKSPSTVDQPLPKQPDETPTEPVTLADKQALAAKHMKRIAYASTVINGLVQVGKLTSGVPFIATIDASIQLVQSMWASVEKVGGLEVAAWRLVERCSAVLIAVQDSIIALKGTVVDEQMEHNLQTLKDVLEDSNLIISKLASRSFLKLYLKGDELGGAINKASQDLIDCVVIFQLQASISSSGWRVQSEEDRKIDTKLLLARMEEAAETDEKMWQALKMDNQCLQETIATMQRTLDAILSFQEEERQYRRAESRFGPPMTALTAHALSDIGSLQLDVTSELNFGLATRKPIVAGRTSIKAVVWATLAAGELSKTAGIQNGGNLEQHIRFLKKGLDVLIRISGGLNDIGVPDWTITPLEVTHEAEIGFGAYSTVFRGVWHGEKVAIKQLNEAVSRKLFLQEVEVWRPLQHPNILPFWGASSTTGPPPYFFVSPYMAFSDVVKYLGTSAGKSHSKTRWLLEIAVGMQYLHSRDILHGDLKGCNVLISNSGHAIICDFGLAALRLEIERLSGDIPRRKGTFRWASPELLMDGRLSTATDVYAFAMTAVEILSGGEIPYGHVDDALLKSEIISTTRRPLLTEYQISNKLAVLLKACWAQRPEERPSFDNIVPILEEIVNDELSVTPEEWFDGRGLSSSIKGSSSLTSTSYRTAGTEYDESAEPRNQQIVSPYSPAHPLPGALTSASSSSCSSPIEPTRKESDSEMNIERVERVAKSYTNHLEHPFDDRLRIALWEPTLIKLGDIGYLTPGGGFCKIYNAIDGPTTEVELPMRHLDESNMMKIDSKAVGQRTVAERGLEIMSSALNLTGFTSIRGQTSVRHISREIKFPLRPNGSRKQSALIIDGAESTFFHTIEPCREYLYRNVDAIVEKWGVVHRLAKHDVIIVVGTLLAQDWAIMTADSRPGVIVNFNVHSQKVLGAPWGTWATQHDIGRGWRGDMPSGQEPRVKCKVSSTSPQRDAVLLAR